ncbi:uncharacterized protein LOC129755512 isoform X1 [Uranotaenia lowii]|uniref:uncharacterized protein LOC129755512 isoform X1 n=1 Tax=Uranotaenia lowii TaxID=190385 RepID=UPI00247AF44F|nr:uncharacterized protein LOC129755512 isoform X1 [Uranotaenia lowii]
MIRSQTSRNGSGSIIALQRLCLIFAILNIFAVCGLLDFCIGQLLAFFDPKNYHFVEEDDDHDTENDDDYETDEIPEWIYDVSYFLIIGPTIVNAVLATILMIGISKKRPGFLYMFRMFCLGQMGLFCFLVLGTFSMVEASLTLGFIIFAALLGVEAWITGNYYTILLRERNSQTETEETNF